MNEVIKYGCTLIGTFVGAGFASGKEIYLFFYRYGSSGLIGIFISNFILFLILYKSIKISKKNNFKNYNEFFNHIFKNKKIKIIINYLINLFLMLSFCIMISGYCSFMKQKFNSDLLINYFFIIIFCVIIFIKKIRALFKINNILIPIIVIFIFFLFIFYIKNNNLTEKYLIKNIYFEKNIINENFSGKNHKKIYFIFDKIIKNDKIININYTKKIKNNILCFFDKKINNNFFIRAILYANYNLISLIPMSITISKLTKNTKKNKLIIFFSAFFILILSIIIFLFLNLGNKKIFLQDIPMINIINIINPNLEFIYCILICCCIITTAVSVGYEYLEKYRDNKAMYRNHIIILVILSFICIHISFSRLVELFYPVFGIIGCIQSVQILRSD